MIDFQSMIKKASVFDVISFLVVQKGIGYPQIDNLFARYRFNVIGKGSLCEPLPK